MIYLGSTWPDEYRGRIFMNNIHGQRLNTDILKPRGSGFIGSHGPDFLLTGDLASQILNIRYGPDGHAWVIDWYDTNACHHNNVEGHDRSNGRVYKVVYGDKKAEPVDLKRLGDEELAMMFAEKNDWYVRHARRILQERAAARLTEIRQTVVSGNRPLAIHEQNSVAGTATRWLAQIADRVLASYESTFRAGKRVVVLDFDGPRTLADTGRDAVVRALGSDNDVIAQKRWLDAKSSLGRTQRGPTLWKTAASQAGVDAIVEPVPQQVAIARIWARHAEAGFSGRCQHLGRPGRATRWR